MTDSNRLDFSHVCKHFLMILGVSLLTVLPAHAQEAGDDELTGELLTKNPNRTSTWPVEIVSRFYVGTSRTAEGSANAGSSRWLWLNAAFREQKSELTLAVTGSYSQNSVDGAEGQSSTLDNPVFAVFKPWKNDALWFTSISTGVAGTAPVNDEARAQTFRGSFGPYVEFVKEFGSVTVTQAFNYSHGLFDKEIDEENEIARATDIVKASTQVWYSITDKLSTGVIFQHFIANTADSKSSSRDQAALIVNYEFNKRFQGDIGYGTTSSSVTADASADQLQYGGASVKTAFLEFGMSL